MKQAFEVVCVVAIVVGLGSAASAVDIETVPVGNVGNAGELSGPSAGGAGWDRICGAVDYAYEIGKFEVTAGQYRDFLNAVAATDTYGLYNSFMNTDSGESCQITQVEIGTSGTYAYDFSGAPSGTEADWASRPVNYVSWGDAARFANWMHNEQPTGAQDLTTTEDGSYYLNGVTSDEALMTVVREDDATWVIPSEDEWYKAAYYTTDLDKDGTHDDPGYYDYPTSSNDTPSNDLDLSGNNATFYTSNTSGGKSTIGSPYWRTEVGAHENSDSPYGTFDQGGNVWEWNEASRDGSYRGVRGGSYGSLDHYDLLASSRYISPPTHWSSGTGFRVALVPEPATMAILALGGIGILRRRRKQ